MQYVIKETVHTADGDQGPFFSRPKSIPQLLKALNLRGLNNFHRLELRKSKRTQLEIQGALRTFEIVEYRHVDKS